MLLKKIIVMNNNNIPVNNIIITYLHMTTNCNTNSISNNYNYNTIIIK